MLQSGIRNGVFGEYLAGGWFEAGARRESLPGSNRLGRCRGWDGGRLPRVGRVGGPSSRGSLTVGEVSVGGVWPGSRIRYDEGGHSGRFRLGRSGLVQSRRDDDRGDVPFGDGRQEPGRAFAWSMSSWCVAGSGSSRPGPGQQLAAHPVQLTDVAPAKAAQVGAQRGGRLDRAAQCAGAPLVQLPPARADATRVIILSPVLARPGARPRCKANVAGRSSPALLTRRRSSKVIWIRSGWWRGSIYWVLLLWVRFCVSKTIIPDSGELPFASSGGLSHAPVRWIGAKWPLWLSAPLTTVAKTLALFEAGVKTEGGSTATGTSLDAMA